MRVRLLPTLRSLAQPGTWRREIGFLLPLYVGYEWVRDLAPDRMALAYANAESVQAVERALRIDIELWANSWLSSHLWLADAASVYYQLAHESVVVVIGIWLWRYHADVYPPLRTALIVTTFASLAIYWLVPLAPPRLAQPGIIDTMLAHPVLFASMDSVTGWVNLYAAMPSVHVAWAVWCALAISIASRCSWSHLAWLYPSATACVVLTTGHHFVLDIAAGGGVVALAWAAVTVLHPDRRGFAVSAARL